MVLKSVEVEIMGSGDEAEAIAILNNFLSRCVGGRRGRVGGRDTHCVPTVVYTHYVPTVSSVYPLCTHC